MMSSHSVLPSPQEEERRFTKPFFVLVVVSLVVLYAYAAAYSPALQAPLRLIVFTVLMVVSGALHWLFTTQRIGGSSLIPYLVGQGLLAFSITLVGDNVSLAVGLNMMMVGEALGAFGLNWRGFVATAYFLGLSAINFILQAGATGLAFWVVPVLSALVFVIIFVWLFNWQNKAREEAQNALRELDTAHRQLAEYAAQVEDLTLANERQRMARELHDTLAQGLAGLVLQLEAIDSHLSRGNTAKAQAITQQAMERARSTLADARRAIDDLRSGHITDTDLETAVRAETDRFTAASGIPCELSLAPPSELPEDVRECALRVVSEALTNIAQHGQAHHATVTLRPNDHALDIEVRDDGIGFDPAQIGAGHYGLIGLRERTRLIGGTLNIDSTPGHGTTLKAQLPVNQA